MNKERFPSYSTDFYINIGIEVPLVAVGIFSFLQFIFLLTDIVVAGREWLPRVQCLLILASIILRAVGIEMSRRMIRIGISPGGQPLAIKIIYIAVLWVAILSMFTVLGTIVP